MAGLSAVGSVGPGLRAAQIAVEIQAAVLRKQLDTIEAQGEFTVQLIQSASIDPGVGRKLDVSS